MENLEQMIRESLPLIRDRIRHPCQCTSNYIFGKDIVSPKEYGKTRFGILQPWRISYRVYSYLGTSEEIIAAVVSFFWISASAYEKALTDKIKHIGVQDILCHQLADWSFEEYEDGSIFKRNEVTLVKHALMTEDFTKRKQLCNYSPYIKKEVK